MLKSIYGIKICFRLLKSQSSNFNLANLNLGFLLIELMMAIFIGLVLISALMRMQALILELQDSFYMRDKALVLVVENLEHSNLNKLDNQLSVCVNGRNFTLNPERKTFEKSMPAAKIKVEWQSLAGKKCWLEI